MNSIRRKEAKGRMSKVRINDLARELEVKSRPILDALEAIGVTGKTHSSSIEADQPKGPGLLQRRKPRRKCVEAAGEAKPKFDLSNI